MLLFYTICLFLTISATAQQCKTFIDTVVAKEPPFTQLETAFVTFSGRKGEYDLGDIKGCKSAEGTKYFVLRAIKSSTTLPGVFTQSESGVCLPKFCISEDVENDQTLLQKLAVFNDWTTTDKLNLYDPDASPSKGPVFYIFALINIVLLLACCLGTFINRQNKAKGASGSFWKSFDAGDTLRSLYKTSKECGQDDKLSTFGFLRFLGAGWVIFIHITRIPSRNIKNQTDGSFDIDNPYITDFIISGSLAVGFFFFMGGFLSAYTIISKILKTGFGVKVYLSHIYHRFIRLYPLTITALFFYWVGVPSLVNGPAMGRFVGEAAKCNDLWWPHMLFIYNFWGLAEPTCASHLWYIYVDFQAYFVLLLVIFLYVKSRKLAYLASFALIVQATALSFLRTRQIWDFTSQWYPSTPCRWNEIFVGVIFAFQYYEFKKLKAQRNFFTFCENIALLRYALILIGFILTLAPVLARNRDPMVRPPFSFGVAFIFMPIATSVPSLFRDFMNLRIFQILGKLSFGVYLFHWQVLVCVVMTTDELPEHITLSMVLYRWLKVFVIANIISLVYHVILEKPSISLEAYFSQPKPKHAPLSDLDISLPSLERKI